ncbi:MAG: hypothetical protein ACREUW_20490 [Burkholderiales bacterium]
MKPRTGAEGLELLRRDPDFSLVLGGPLFQLFRRLHLSDDALHLARQRVIVIMAVAWLPLLVLSALDGRFAGDSVTVPFLLDVEVHVRYLFALPLLIAAELVVHGRMRPLVKIFLERNLIPAPSLPRFGDALASAFRLRNSLSAELLLVAFVYGIGISVVWRQYLALDAATWYATPGTDGTVLTLAGWWYGYVSLPIFQFLLCRWYFRLFIWARFLWQVSRIDLSLIPTHPDRLAGLGFLSGVVFAFAPLAVAHGAMLAGPLANRILYLGAGFMQYKAEIAIVVIFVVVLFVGPLLVFTPQLSRAKRIGLREYGTLAERYVREFDAKWLRGGAPAGEPLVGSADVQSLADLANGYEVVRSMRIAPITRDMLVGLVAATGAPLVPLALTMMPLEELLKRLFGILF